MSYLVTAAALDQSGADLTIPSGGLTLTSGSITMGSGTTIGSLIQPAALITFNGSDNRVEIGSSSAAGNLKFNSSSSAVIQDSNGNEVLEFAAATSSPTDHLKITPGTSSTNVILAAISDSSAASIEINPKGTGSTLKVGSGVANFGGVGIAGGSGGSAFTTLKSGTNTDNDEITLPSGFGSSDAGKILKVAAGASTNTITLELADESGSATYNDITSSAFTALSELSKGNIYAVNDLSSSISQDIPGSSASSNGDEITVIDANGGATSSATITLTAGSGTTINGNSTIVLDGAYQAVTLKYNSTTAKWNIC